MNSRLLYDTFGILYGICLVFLFVDAVVPRRIVNRTALVLLFGVFCLETVWLLMRMQHPGAGYSLFDATLLVSWLIVLVALVLDTLFHVDLLLFFVNLVGFALVVYDNFERQMRVQHQVTKAGDLLVIHIVFALISYVAFAFAFVFSIMYLLEWQAIKSKHWNQWFFRLPSLERLDAFTFRSVVVGIPFLLIASILGIVWSKVALGYILWRDPKFIATEILWLSYVVYAFLRVRSGWSDPLLAWYNLFCFGGVVLNFFVVSEFSLFHPS